MKIGIIGVGFVGGAVRKYFAKNKHELFLYDKYKKIGSQEEINNAEIIFIATPTPYGSKGYDDSAVKNALVNIKGSKIVVIKSTVLPGSTNRFQKIFPKLKILFNPEFLTEKNSHKDFANPTRQIIGYTQKSKSVAKEVMKILPRASYSEIMPSAEAEMVKYATNAFLALKVIYANEIYDVSEKLNLDYATVKNALAADKRIGNSHMDIFHDGYRGFGGHCLPKDLMSLIDFANTLEVPVPLLKQVKKINTRFAEKSNV